MVFLSKEIIEQHLSMTECIDAVEKAFQLLHKGVSIHSLRKRMRLPGGVIGWGNLLSMMPAYYDENYLGAKVFTVYPDNTGTALPTHQGLVLLFDSHNGSLLACADADTITELRTAATTALATKLLARPDASSVAFIGAGAQAFSHLDALLLVRDIRKVTVFDLNAERCQRLARHAAKKYGVEAIAAKSGREATWGADIICTATTAPKPVLQLADVAPGTHINAIGACAPIFRELSTDLVQASSFFGDNREAIMNEAGDFLIPLQEGSIGENHLKGDLSDVVGGTAGRSSGDEITIFKSLGIANEDLAAVKVVYEKYTGKQ